MTALIFALIKENYVAEQGARMVSMDGASKNAADMIEKLNLSFNRMRQAVSLNRSRKQTIIQKRAFSVASWFQTLLVLQQWFHESQLVGDRTSGAVFRLSRPSFSRAVLDCC